MEGMLSSVVLLLVLAGGSAAQIAPPLIVFGDSTVDVGNNNFINTTLDFNVNFPPFGQQYFGKPSGRFSNGRVFMDFICDYVGIPHVSPYLQPDADFSKGVNFGSGGAGVLRETNEGLVLPLETQLKYFGEFHDSLVEKLGPHQAKKYFSDAIYFFSIGNNDYMGGYFSVAKLREQYTPQEFVVRIVSEFIKSFEFLYSKGARKLVILEVGPLGCIPALRQFHPSQGCFQPAEDLGVAHNMAIKLAIQDWTSSHPDVTVLMAALHDFMLDRINDPKAFGYVEGKAACCGSGLLRGSGPCGRPNAITKEAYKACDNPEDYVFWDFYHGSERMHEEFAKDLWDGPKPVTVPMTIRQLVELGASGSCEDEQLGTNASGQANPLDAPIEVSSF